MSVSSFVNLAAMLLKICHCRADAFADFHGHEEAIACTQIYDSTFSGASIVPSNHTPANHYHSYHAQYAYALFVPRKKTRKKKSQEVIATAGLFVLRVTAKTYASHSTVIDSIL